MSQEEVTHVEDLYQGEALSKYLGWRDDQGNYFDLSNYTGKALIIKDYKLVKEIDLGLVFTDSETKNIQLTISGEDSATLDLGYHQILLKINQSTPVYLPNKGCIKLFIKKPLEL